MKSVAILMSTYNGEKYLKEQLDSIIKQTYKNITIYVRDDGSTDSTINLLDDYKNKIKIIKGKNIGIIKSFKELLKISHADYYSFADQDDIWESDKISRAVELISLNNVNKPILYASNYDYYDENMNFIGHCTNKKSTTFCNSLVETISPGMTMVFNNEAKKIMLNSLNNKCGLHDGWINKICAGLGIVLYDDSVTVKYRRHSNNATNYEKKFYEKIIWIFKNFLFGNHWNNLLQQLNWYCNCFENRLSENNKILLHLFVDKKSLFGQIKKIFWKERFKADFFSDIKLRIMFLFWKL